MKSLPKSTLAARGIATAGGVAATTVGQSMSEQYLREQESEQRKRDLKPLLEKEDRDMKVDFQHSRLRC